MLDANEVEGVLVAKLDRLTRSVRDLGDLVDRYFGSRCSLLSVSDAIDTRTAAGRQGLPRVQNEVHRELAELKWVAAKWRDRRR